MKTFGITDNTNQTPSKHLLEKKCLRARPPKMKNEMIKCKQNKRFTFSMYEQPICKF